MSYILLGNIVDFNFFMWWKQALFIPYIYDDLFMNVKKELKQIK